MSDQSKTEPAFKLSRERRPWWIAAAISGIGAGVAIAAALGPAASAHEPRPAVTSVVPLPSGTLSLDERLQRIETTLRTLSDDMIEVKTRLPKKRGE